MTTNVYLIPATIQGGVYNTNGTYTFFLNSGVCVLPKELVERCTQGETPEEHIEYVIYHGISSKFENTPLENNTEDEICKKYKTFLNLRNYE